MRKSKRCIASLIVLPLVCWPAAAAAQPSAEPLVQPPDRMPVAPTRLAPPEFRLPGGDYRMAPGPVRSGLIGAVPLGRDVQVAVGRFAVPNFSAPRIEPAEIRRRDRGMAAVGFSFRF